MGDGAAVPPGLWERIRQMIRDEIGTLLRSGFLRNASISEGGLTIKGGFLRMLSAVTGGVESFYVGPVSPTLPDGSYQPGWVVRRNDGTRVLILIDPIPSEGDYNQFLAWLDRQGHIVLSDDTDSGLGLARPYLGAAFYPSRDTDFLRTVSTTWETMWRAKMSKQHPRLYVEAWGFADAAGTTGQVRVVVNGTQLGDIQAAGNAGVNQYTFGPAVIGGNFGDTLSIEIQAQRTAGTGGVKVGAAWVQGQQS